METPWGTSQGQPEAIGEGIRFFSTASHGGMQVSAKQNAKIHPALRIDSGWYEEDCAWAIVAISFPEMFKPEQVRDAESTIKNWMPHEWMEATGQKLNPEESRQLREEIFNETHKNDYLVVCASGDWKKGVPLGYVECIATIGGKRRDSEEKVFFVPKDEYHKRGEFSFVVDPKRHLEVNMKED